MSEPHLTSGTDLTQPATSPQVASTRLDLEIGLPTRAEIFEEQLWVSGANRWARVDLEKREIVSLSERDDLARLLQPQPRHNRLLRWREVDDVRDRIEVQTLDGQPLTQVDDVPVLTNTFNSLMVLTQKGENLLYSVDGQLYVSALDGQNSTWSAKLDSSVLTRLSSRTPEGQLLVTSLNEEGPNVQLWDAQTLVATTLLSDSVLAAFASLLVSSLLTESNQLALGGSEGEVGIFDLHSNMQVMAAAERHQGLVNDLAFSPDGTVLASASEDRTVRLWDSRTGKAYGVLSHSESVQFVRFTPDGRGIISIDTAGTVLFWDDSQGEEESNAAPGPVLVPAIPDTEAEREAYFERARKARVDAFAKRSWRMYQQTTALPRPQQPHETIIEAYEDAKRHVVNFDTTVQTCANALNVKHRLRPNGVKDANRAIEKMSGRGKDGKPKPLPLDLLAGTLICSSFEQMYDVAEQLVKGAQGIEVVRFRDRIVDKVESGYGDLQLIVSLEGHLAEIKVVHEVIQQVDRYEHRVYEIQREIEAKFLKELPPVEGYVTSALHAATQAIYTQAWDLAFSPEGEADD